MEILNTVLFSDVHLGSPTSRAYYLLNALKELRFKKLVIVGDMFEDLNFKHLTSTQWELLEHIGKLSRRDVEVVWIEGNHDAKFVHFMASMIGIPVQKEYEWVVNDKHFLALHGHQFDSFMTNNIVAGRLLAALYALLQRIMSSHVFDTIMLKLSDRWLRLTEQVAVLAIDYAKKKKADVVVCGHTHFIYSYEKDNVAYFNLGCWNNNPSYILLVADNGTASYKVVP
jgi:UDP-2,3-diacylglucosamine pyrophosphatase LpxH